MHPPDHIEQELDIARTDLEASLAALREVVREKLDVAGHARRAIEQAKVRAAAAMDRALVSLTAALYRAEASVRRRPELATGFLLGMVTFGTLALAIAARRRSSAN
jgi:hypothetical protein